MRVYCKNELPKSILVKPSSERRTSTERVSWNEESLRRLDIIQKQHICMKIDEPNTPYIKYDPATDTVTNWEVIPNSVRAAHGEPSLFRLNSDDVSNSLVEENQQRVTYENEPDEWKEIDNQERKAQSNQAQKKHDEFSRKRAMHYLNEAACFKR